MRCVVEQSWCSRCTKWVKEWLCYTDVSTWQMYWRECDSRFVSIIQKNDSHYRPEITWEPKCLDQLDRTLNRPNPASCLLLQSLLACECVNGARDWLQNSQRASFDVAITWLTRIQASVGEEGGSRSCFILFSACLYIAFQSFVQRYVELKTTQEHSSLLRSWRLSQHVNKTLGFFQNAFYVMSCHLHTPPRLHPFQ